ncbi:MAG: hypothetical protein KKG14_09515 [Alphaproteobacteria bacterium]|nr:hypothetical protein [Alphaproteobacteria bacterium]MBU2269680.1 hypothetical protein [Alphaproteobacteria bacterium]MBU2418924.1 hypothetical protein [Alphaproteobacteria bacterium]
MKTRRPNRRRRKDRQMWAVQHHRLMQIAEGRMEPHFEREHLFLWTLRSRHIADPAAFILPGLLFMAESLTDPLPKLARRADDDDDADEADEADEAAPALAFAAAGVSAS